MINIVVENIYLDDVHFTRRRKIWIDDLIIHLLASKNRVNVVECLSFYQELKKDDFVTITPQAFSDKRSIFGSSSIC